MKKFTLAMLIFCFSGCSLMIDSYISKYSKVADSVSLGNSKESVLSKLNPTQKGLPAKYKKSKEAYYEGDDLIEIHYFRTGRQPDGLKTDDEFTPYIFKNNKLVGIGWTVIGGPKSRGEVIQPAPNINQTTIVK